MIIKIAKQKMGLAVRRGLAWSVDSQLQTGPLNNVTDITPMESVNVMNHLKYEKCFKFVMAVLRLITTSRL